MGTDLTVERRNLGIYHDWLATSRTLDRAGLRNAVITPTPIAAGCSSRVLTMSRVQGTMISSALDNADGAQGEGHATVLHVLARALSVAALSIIEGGLFHADLHSGNMLLCEGGQQIAFIDFGVCGN